MLLTEGQICWWMSQGYTTYLPTHQGCFQSLPDMQLYHHHTTLFLLSHLGSLEQEKLRKMGGLENLVDSSLRQVGHDDYIQGGVHAYKLDEGGSLIHPACWNREEHPVWNQIPLSQQSGDRMDDAVEHSGD